MTFGAPAWLWLLLLPPLVVLLHLRRPRTHTVSSLLVWRRVESPRAAQEKGRANAFDWPLVLQVAALIALVLALAEPRIGAAAAGHQVYFLDASARMLAGREGETRLDRAFERLVAEVASLPTSTEATVIVVGPRPYATLVRAAGGPAAGSRLARPTGSAAAADWRSAVELAGAAVRDGEPTAFTVLSDETGAAALRAALQGSPLSAPRLRSLALGPGWVDVGITAAAWLGDPDDPGRVRLTADLASSVPVAAFAVEVEHRRQGSTTFLPWDRFVVPAEGGNVGRLAEAVELPGPGTLRLMVSGLTEALSDGASDEGVVADEYPADDTVELAVEADARARVLVVGDVHPRLALLLELVGGLEVFVAGSMPADTSDYDLVIVTSPTETGVPRTSALWLGALPGGASGLRTVSGPQVSGWAAEHRLHPPTGWVDLEVEAALAAPLLSGATVVLSSGELPLVQARTTNVGRQAVVAFALEDSNWTELASFPSFVAAFVDWVAPVERRGGLTACRAAMVCPLPRGSSSGPWWVTGPSGFAVSSADPQVSADPFADLVWPPGSDELAFVPSLPGTYLLETPSGTHEVPVVANPAAFASAGQEPAEVEGQEPGPAGPDALLDLVRLLVAVGVALVALNALLVSRSRGARRWRRAFGRHVLTAATIGLLAAAWWRLPTPATGAPSGPAVRVSFDEPGVVEAPVVKVTGLGGSSQGGGVAPGEGQAGRDAIVFEVPTVEFALGLVGGVARAHGGSGILLTDPGLTELPVEVALEQGARLNGDSLRIDARAAGTPEPMAASVTTFSVPQRARSGATVEALVTVEGARSVAAETVVGVDGETYVAADVELQAGANTFTFPLTFVEPGPHLVSVAVAGPGFESRATRLVTVGEAPRALVIASDPESASAMSAALRLQGFEPSVEPPLNAPWTQEGWREWDLAVLLNVPAHSLHTAQLELLRGWVEEDAGGLLLLGGETSFGPGGYLRTPLEELSPLSAQVPQEAPEVTMLFVLDRSGSMQQQVGGSTRMGIAKEAMLSAMELLGPESLVGVVVFDSESQVLVPIQSVSEIERVAQVVEGVRANGGTALYPALLQARDLLADVTSSAVHVVVLTDGLSQPGDFAGVLGDLKGLGASVSFVGIGSGADRVQLGDLAGMAGGALHVTDDVRALPSILAQEALLSTAELVRDEPVEVVGAGAPSAHIEGVPTRGLIGGYVLTEPKPGADVHLETVGEEPAPILASWRFGLGRVVSFASHGAGRWTADWLAGPDFTQVWGQLARWASAAEVARGLDVALRSTGRTVEVEARVTGPDDTPQVGREVLVEVDGAPAARLWEASEGRYVGSFEVVGAGLYEVRVTVAGGPEPVTRQVYVEAVPPGGAPPTLASRVLVAATSGAFVGQDDGSPAISSGGWAWQPRTWPWLGLALACFAAYLLLTYGLPDRSDVRWALGRGREALLRPTRRRRGEPSSALGDG